MFKVTVLREIQFIKEKKNPEGVITLNDTAAPC